MDGDAEILKQGTPFAADFADYVERLFPDLLWTLKAFSRPGTTVWSIFIDRPFSFLFFSLLSVSVDATLFRSNYLFCFSSKNTRPQLCSAFSAQPADEMVLLCSVPSLPRYDIFAGNAFRGL